MYWPLRTFYPRSERACRFVLKRTFNIAWVLTSQTVFEYGCKSITTQQDMKNTTYGKKKVQTLFCGTNQDLQTVNVFYRCNQSCFSHLNLSCLHVSSNSVFPLLVIFNLKCCALCPCSHHFTDSQYLSRSYAEMLSYVDLMSCQCAMWLIVQFVRNN